MDNGTIYVQAYYRGGMTSFEVLCNNGIYRLFIDGHQIATLQKDGKWHQVDGNELPDEVIESIGIEIDKPQNLA